MKRLAAILLLTSIVGFFELSKALGVHEKTKKINGLEIPAILFIVAYYFGIYFLQNDFYTVMLIIGGFMAFMFVYVIRRKGFESEIFKV